MRDLLLAVGLLGGAGALVLYVLRRDRPTASKNAITGEQAPITKSPLVVSASGVAS